MTKPDHTPAAPPPLSTAMLRGARKRPQAFGVLYLAPSPAIPRGATCALGAAIEGSEKGGAWRPNSAVQLDRQLALFRRYPVLGQLVVDACPAVTEPGETCCRGRYCPCHVVDRDTNLTTLIIHLSDGLHWSRQKIARWLKSIGL